jgi:DNA-binding NarL/FixJ family response regulator
MSTSGSQILFLGELPFWLKITQSILEAPASSFQFSRAHSFNDAMRRLNSEQWHALLLDLSHPSAQELLAARKLHDGLDSLPIVALLPISDPQFHEAAAQAGAASSLVLSELNVASLQHALVTAINTETLRNSARKVSSVSIPFDQAAVDGRPISKLDAISHAVNNLLCVISANADIITDQLDATHMATRSLTQIKKATKNASDLIRLLKTP